MIILAEHGPFLFILCSEVCCIIYHDNMCFRSFRDSVASISRHSLILLPIVICPYHPSPQLTLSPLYRYIPLSLQLTLTPICHYIPFYHHNLLLQKKIYHEHVYISVFDLYLRLRSRKEVVAYIQRAFHRGKGPWLRILNYNRLRDAIDLCASQGDTASLKAIAEVSEFRS